MNPMATFNPDVVCRVRDKRFWDHNIYQVRMFATGEHVES